MAKKPIIKNDKASVADTANAYIQNGTGRVHITPNRVRFRHSRRSQAAKSISRMTIRVTCAIAVSSDGAIVNRPLPCIQHPTRRKAAVAAH